MSKTKQYEIRYLCKGPVIEIVTARSPKAAIKKILIPSFFEAREKK